MPNNSRIKTVRGPAGQHKNTSPLVDVVSDDKFKKPERKSYTLVRIEDDIMDLYRDIAKKFNYTSHGPYMNEILRLHANEKLGIGK